MDCCYGALNVGSRGLLKLFSFTIFSIICLYQVYIIAKSFFEYPRKIHTYDTPIKLIDTLPGITLCTNNRISLKKLMERNSVIAKAITDRFPNYVMNHEPQIGRDFLEFRNDLDKIFQSLNYTPEAEENNSTMNNLFTLRPDQSPFIKLIECARTWSDTIECDKLSRLESIQDRRCITFLHFGALYYDSVNRRELFNNYDPKQGDNDGYFDSKELIKFVIDFNPEDYADLKRQIGGRLLFHSNKYVASTTELDYFVTRGYRYEFSIDRTDIILMGKPYDSCTNSYASKIHLFMNNINPRVPLYGDTCFHNCLIRNMINIYHCWPPTLPYFHNDSLDPQSDIKPCTWIGQNIPVFKELANTSEESYYKIPDIMRNYMKIRRYCWSKCLLPCLITRYAVTPTKSVWPSDVQLLFDRSGTKRKLRHCCAQIRVKFKNHHYKVQQYMAKYNLLDVVQDIGGVLAVWLGLSIISVYHAIQKLADMCAQQFTKRKERQRAIKVDQASSSYQ